jgi:transcription factor E
MNDTKERMEYVVSELVGDDALEAVDYLTGKQNVSEFIIAEDLGIEIHEMRNILYRCYDHNICTFVRKKDKKKGWYICYWNFNKEQIPHLAEKIRKKKIVKLKKRLATEQEGQFYMCQNACVRMDFDKAVEYSFHCPECGDIQQMQDNARTIAFLTEQIEKLSAQE